MPVEIEIPELALTTHSAHTDVRPMPLEVRQTKGAGPQHDVRTSIRLGGPDCSRMQPRADEDPHLADRREGAEFWSVLLTLSVEPADDESIASAWLRIDLSAATGAAPTAFGLDPERHEETVSVEASGSAEIAVQPVKVGGSVKRAWVIHQAEILARNRLRSDPSWSVRPSQGRPIDGEQDFVLIAKVPNGTTGAHGRVAFGAEIAWRQKGLLRDRVHEVSWPGDAADFALG